MTEESFLHAVWPFSCSRRIRLRWSGKMFSNTTSWNRLPSTVETVPKSQEKRAVFPPCLWLDVSSLSDRLSLLSARSASPRFVMLIVSNSGHHRYVYFPFSSPSFLSSARHTLAGLRRQSLVFVLGYWTTKNTPFVEQHPPFGYHFWWSFNHILFPKEIPSFIFYRNVMYLGFYVYIWFYVFRAK